MGLLIQTCGYAWGWAGHETTVVVLWYVGFVVLVGPFAALLLLGARTGGERLAGSLAYSLLMYGSWLMSSPVLATRYDESLHVSTLVGLVRGDGFFADNSLLPVSPHYPGLELATAGVHWLSGLPLFGCQVLVVLVARTTFVLALFWLASRIGHSTRVGGVAVLLYSASAQFYFFNAQFSYQTVAIAMLMAALCLLVQAFDAPRERPWRLLLLAQVALAALAITHHLTSWLVLATLWLLTALFRLGGDTRRYRLSLVTAEIATLVAAAWTALIAPLLVDYLGPIFSGATTQLRTLLALDGGGRTIGADTAGIATPRWELAVMAGSILLWVLLLVPACWVAWRGSSLGRSRARYLPLVLAAGYPFLQFGRFSPAAGEIADRASTFVTMAMALVVGVWLVPRLDRLSGLSRLAGPGRVALLVVPAALVLVLGGTILGSGPDWQRTTGPFLAGAEQRSVDAETIAVAEWAGRYLPAGSHVAADVTLGRVLPNFAPVIPVTAPGGQVNVTPLFISTTIGQAEISLIQDNDVDFVAVDTRLIGRTVRSGCYFEGSCGFGPSANTLNAAQLEKFEGYQGFDLVLDGPVKIYDVRSLRGALSTFVDRPEPGVPGVWHPLQVGAAALVVLVGLLRRGRLLHPRRLRDAGIRELVLVLPTCMALGVVGVLTGFHAWVGSVVLLLLLLGLLVSTRRAEPEPVVGRSGGPDVVTLAWSGAIGLCVALSLSIGGLSAWHGLFGAPPLPPPAGSPAALRGGSPGATSEIPWASPAGCAWTPASWWRTSYSAR